MCRAPLYFVGFKRYHDTTILISTLHMLIYRFRYTKLTSKHGHASIEISYSNTVTQLLPTTDLCTYTQPPHHIPHANITSTRKPTSPAPTNPVPFCSCSSPCWRHYTTTTISPPHTYRWRPPPSRRRWSFMLFKSLIVNATAQLPYSQNSAKQDNFIFFFISTKQPDTEQDKQKSEFAARADRIFGKVMFSTSLFEHGVSAVVLPACK